MAAELSRSLPNFVIIRKLCTQILRLQNLARSYDKTAYWFWKWFPECNMIYHQPGKTVTKRSLWCSDGCETQPRWRVCETEQKLLEKLSCSRINSGKSWTNRTKQTTKIQAKISAWWQTVCWLLLCPQIILWLHLNVLSGKSRGIIFRSELGRWNVTQMSYS